MKTPQIHLVLVAFLLGLAPLARAADAAQTLIIEAQAAFKSGDFEKAKAKFRSVVQMNPKNQTALGYLSAIEKEEAKRGGNQEGQLTKLILPSVNLREATLAATLEYLRQAVTKTSDGKQAVNFVVQLPAQQANTATVTLELTTVPFTEVLKYVGALTQVDFVYDKYAILVKPHAATAAQ